eukprot:560893-Ditylum_brightwellii.AAC.1
MDRREVLLLFRLFDAAWPGVPPSAPPLFELEPAGLDALDPMRPTSLRKRTIVSIQASTTLSTPL